MCKFKLLLFYLAICFANCDKILVSYENEDSVDFSATIDSIDKLSEVFSDKQDLYSILIENQNVPVLSSKFLDGIKVRYLTMYTDHIKNIEPGAFEGSTVTERITLAENEIETLRKGVFNNKTSGTLLLGSNKISTIEDTAFEKSEFENLYLDDNKLTELTAEMFDKSKIKNLRLSYNNISKIQEKTFQGVKGLFDIDLGHNKIEEIGKIFSNLPQVTIVSLNGNQIKTLSPGCFDNTPLSNIYLRNNNLTEIKKGIFYNYTTIDLSYNKIMSIEGGAFEKNPIIENLYLVGNNIKNLKSSALKALRYLDILSLDENDMTNIEPGAFGSLQVRSLYLNSNKLSSISKDFFKNSTILELILYNNSITDIEDDSFKDIKGLEHIDLSNNGLTKIKKGVFSFSSVKIDWYSEERPISSENEDDKRQISEISFDRNHITEIEDGALEGVIVRSLILSGNKFAQLNGRMFNKCNVTNLFLGSNGIKKIYEDTFKNVIQLTFLDLSNNEIEYIGSAFNNIQFLYELMLDNNKIKFLPTDSFRGSNLYQVNLRNNQLTEIRKNVFSNIKNLDFSNNLINIIEDGALEDTKKDIILSNNKLGNLNSSSLGGLRVLSSLSLNNNSIESIGPGTFKDFDLYSLDLSHNQLTAINKDIFAGAKIETLLLTNNKIHDIEIGSFNSSEYLSFIDLNNNKLTEIKKGMFNIPLDNVNLENNDISKIDAEAMGELKWDSLYISNNPIAIGKNVAHYTDIIILD